MGILGNEVKRAVHPTPVAIAPERLAYDEVRTNPSLAQEITADAAKWYVLSVYSGQENVAAAHLIARRFGIYQPTVEKRDAHGRRTKQRELMFPGYLFVWVWSIEKQCRRILSCPGVIGLLPTVANPAVMPDALIDLIQVKEWGEDLAKSAAKRRRGWRRGPGAAVPQEPMHITIHTRSAFESIDGLDANARISILAKALALG